MFDEEFTSFLNKLGQDAEIARTLSSASVDVEMETSQIYNLTLLTYPPNSDKPWEKVSLHLRDINCLKAGRNLNDQLVDFYLKFTLREKLSPALREEIHCFSSLFYNSLTITTTATINGNSTRQSGWTRRIPDLFGKKFIVVPIVTEKHWILAIICNSGRVSATTTTTAARTNGSGSGSGGEPDPKRPKLDYQNLNLNDRPLILLLDSSQQYPLNRQKIGNTLRSFLTLEWKFRQRRSALESQDLESQARIQPVIFTKENMPLRMPKVPQQSNNVDCGIYLLQFFQTFFSVRNPISYWMAPVEAPPVGTLSPFHTPLQGWLNFCSLTRDTEKVKREEVFQTIRSLLRASKAGFLALLPDKCDGLPVQGMLGGRRESEKLKTELERKQEMLEVLGKFFRRYGRRLGNASGEVSSSSSSQVRTQIPLSSSSASPSKPPPPVEIDVDVEKMKQALNVDEGKPLTQIRVRMTDGTWLRVTLNLCQSVREIRSWICLARPDQASKSFCLLRPYPLQEFKDEEISLENAGLRNALIVQKLMNMEG